jgi:hypothetical protein
MPAGKIDNGKSPVAKTDALRDIKPLVVWTSVY